MMVLIAEIASLSSGLFAGISLYSHRSSTRVWSVTTSFVFLVMVGVFLSRAAILSFVCGVLFCFAHKRRSKRMAILAVIGVSLLGGALFSINPSSSIGRIYIWRICLRMIASNPMGLGWNGFIHHYMRYQADFFKCYPDSPFRMLADDVAFPYNEYINVMISYGFVGISILIALIWNCLATHATSRMDVIIKSLLVNYLVFSFFSYPSAELYTGLLFPLLLILAPKKFCHRIVNILMIFTLFIAFTLYLKRDILSHQIVCGVVCSNPQYEMLVSEERDRFILFPELEDMLYESIPCSSNNQLRLEAVMNVALNCPNTKSYCRAGDMLVQSGESLSAVPYYEMASFMVPARYRPRYNLFNIYMDEGHYEKARELGLAIISSDMKVRSSEVLAMRTEVKRRMLENNLL